MAERALAEQSARAQAELQAAREAAARAAEEERRWAEQEEERRRRERAALEERLAQQVRLTFWWIGHRH